MGQNCTPNQPHTMVPRLTITLGSLRCLSCRLPFVATTTSNTTRRQNKTSKKKQAARAQNGPKGPKSMASPLVARYPPGPECSEGMCLAVPGTEAVILPGAGLTAFW